MSTREVGDRRETGNLHRGLYQTFRAPYQTSEGGTTARHGCCNKAEAAVPRRKTVDVKAIHLGTRHKCGLVSDYWAGLTPDSGAYCRASPQSAAAAILAC